MSTLYASNILHVGHGWHASASANAPLMVRATLRQKLASWSSFVDVLASTPPGSVTFPDMTQPIAIPTPLPPGSVELILFVRTNDGSAADVTVHGVDTAGSAYLVFSGSVGDHDQLSVEVDP